MNRYLLSKAGIDVNEGMRRFNNNKDIYEKFLLTFPEDEHYKLMVEAIEKANVEDAFQAAHALKGVSGTLSLVTLHAELIPLVEELRSHSLEKTPELLPPVKESYEIVVEALNKEIEKAKSQQ